MEAERWGDGHLRASCLTPEELYERIVEALAAVSAAEFMPDGGKEMCARAVSAAEVKRLVGCCTARVQR